MMKTGWVLLILSLLGGTMEAKADVLISLQGDPVRGKAIYVQCSACHSPERHRTGPKHCGLLERKAGTSPGYQYSKAMQQANVVWNAQTLNQFLYAPMDFVPGTSMGIAGIKDDGNRRDLIAYLIAINGLDECD